MATTQEYLSQLQTDKQTLVGNLVTKGVSASNDETFTELVPKVLDISSGGDVVIADASYLFYNGARTDNLEAILDVCKNVTNCAYMFYNCRNLTELNISSLDTSNVTDMYQMFRLCQSIMQFDLSNFNTSKVTNMSQMFMNNNYIEKIDISSFSTQSVTDNSAMFQSCNNLTTLIINNQDLFRITNTNIFAYTPIASGTGYVYVPDNMVETYKTATNWSDYSSQIKPISELPEEA